MELHAGWCQKCWANWSVWFMRAEGMWMDLERGIRLQSQRCSCDACAVTRQAIAQADRAEQVASR